MAIRITNPEADRLTRRLAKREGVGLTEAIIIAMREALQRRTAQESPLETVKRLHKESGIVITEEARKPLPRSVYHEMSGDFDGDDEDEPPETSNAR